MLYVVLGMHKSGTTLVSQILHHSGVNMDDEIDPNITYDSGNKYERQSVLHLNMELLGATDYTILDLARPAHLVPTPEQQDRMRDIVTTCEERYEHWGFKDPRTALTYPAWEPVLPVHRLIAVYRDPREIWPRYRFLRFYHAPTNVKRATMFLSRWYEHNLGIIEVLERTELDFLVLRYRELMTSDEEFEALERFVGLPLEDRRDKSLYRNRARPSRFLAIAEALVKNRYGHSVAEVMERLAELRERSHASLAADRQPVG